MSNACSTPNERNFHPFRTRFQWYTSSSSSALTLYLKAVLRMAEGHDMEARWTSRISFVATGIQERIAEPGNILLLPKTYLAKGLSGSVVFHHGRPHRHSLLYASLIMPHDQKTELFWKYCPDTHVHFPLHSIRTACQAINLPRSFALPCCLPVVSCCSRATDVLKGSFACRIPIPSPC